MRWNTISDTLSVAETKQLHEDSQLTKRALLRQSSANCDPLGLLGSITITAKILIQKLEKRDMHRTRHNRKKLKTHARFEE